MVELWTVEWSLDQDCAMVDLLAATTRKNTQALLQGRSPRYVLIAIVGSYDEAHDVARRFRAQLEGAPA